MSTLEQRVIDLGKQRDQFERESKAWRELAESRLKEIEALAAHVERLKDAALKPKGQRWRAWLDNVKHILMDAPKTSLAEHDAEVIKKFADSLVEVGNVPHITDDGETDSYFECGDILEYAEKYAQRVNDGE